MKAIEPHLSLQIPSFFMKAILIQFNQVVVVTIIFFVYFPQFNIHPVYLFLIFMSTLVIYRIFIVDLYMMTQSYHPTCCYSFTYCFYYFSFDHFTQIINFLFLNYQIDQQSHQQHYLRLFGFLNKQSAFIDVAVFSEHQLIFFEGKISIYHFCRGLGLLCTIPRFSFFFIALSRYSWGPLDLQFNQITIQFHLDLS